MDSFAVEHEVKQALTKAPKGLTARELQDKCESSGDLQELVKVLHGMKFSGAIKSAGMRESQALYQIGDKTSKPIREAEIEKEDAMPAAPEKPQPSAPKAPATNRSLSGLRSGLFDMLDRIAAGTVENNTAKTYAHTAQTIVKSLEVQLEYERMKFAKELPTMGLDSVELVALESK